MKANPIQMAAQILDARDAMKSLLGDKFDAKMTQYKGYIRRMMALDKCGEIEAMIKISHRLEERGALNGYAQALLMSAVAEMCEEVAT
jgi:hypothetical protein